MRAAAPRRPIRNRMSVLELDISTSPEAVFRANGGGSGAFWFDGPADGGASFMGFPCTAQLALRADGVVEVCDAHGAFARRGAFAWLQFVCRHVRVAA